MTGAATLSRPVVGLLLLTVLFGGLNVVKPLHVDDAAYFYDARQIAAHPLDPYGTWILWYQEPNHANVILAPPVVPYTWALGLCLFGDHPWACKLLLLPFAFLLIYAVYSLARRFATGMEWPVTILTILSPALLPAFNFMLDVPALALALMGVELFLRACDDGRYFKAACAGVIVGIGFETKFTACVAVAAIVLASLLRRRWGLGTVAVLLAAHVFCAWEFLIAVLYGESHFFHSFPGSRSPEGNPLLTALQGLILTKGPLVTCLLSLLGGVTPALLLLGMVALGLRRRWLLLTVALFLGGVLSIALIDSHFEGIARPSPRLFGPQEVPPMKFEVADVIFAVFGGVLLLITGLVARVLLRSSSGTERREVLFLLGWLGLEIAAYFPLTPFPAVRRILAILVVMTLLLGRCVATNDLSRKSRSTLIAIVLIGVLLGFSLMALDFQTAKGQKDGAEQAANWIREQNNGGRVWYTGHWGFQYYAEHNGMAPLIVDYDHEENDGLPAPSTLERDDWIVIPDDRIEQQKFDLDPDYIKEVARLTFDDPIPLRTLVAFHGWTVAVQHLESPRFQVRIFQVQKSFVPRLRAKP